MLRAAGGSPVDAVGVASALFLRHPHIKERLLAAQSPEQARAVVNSHLPEIEAGIRRQLAVNRGREQAKTWYREEIAGAMGVPVSALRAPSNPFTPVANKTYRLSDDEVLRKVRRQTKSLFVRDLFKAICKPGWLA